MIPRPPSLARRLALPLGLSLLLHALLAAAVSLLPAAIPSSPSTTGTRAAPVRVLMNLDGPRRKPRPPIPGWTDPLEGSEPRLKLHTPVSIDIAAIPTPGAAPASQGDGNRPGGNGGHPDRPAARGLLTVSGPARRIVYVVDRSLSMAQYDALDVVRREVLASLRALPPAAQFQIVAYNSFAELLLPGKFVPATPGMVDEAARRLEGLSASGETNHVRALEQALYLLPAPDLVFLVTDADELKEADVQRITRLNRGRAVIHVVELTAALPDGPESLLARLARSNGGSHRRARPLP